MERYRVAESFLSINGEGKKAGQLAVFVRFTGCNLNCSYCDTRWANQPDAPFAWMTKEEIYARICELGAYNVTLTGGEPLLQPQIGELLEYLMRDERLYVEIETNGSVDITPYMALGERISMTVDYKLPGSGMEDAMLPVNFASVRAQDTVKFVCGSMQDLDRAAEVMERYRLIGRCACYLSPVFGRIEPAQMVEFMIEQRLNGVNLQIQMHKVIWDPELKGV